MFKRFSQSLWIAVLGTTIFGAPACAQAQDTAPNTAHARAENMFVGSWINDRGSLVKFTQVSRPAADELSGQISGFYQTNLGQPDKSKKFPLTGFTQGDQITFTVNFQGFGSLTSWTGQLTQDAQGEEYIRTLWNLTRDVDDRAEDDDLWKSITAGASDFRRHK